MSKVKARIVRFLVLGSLTLFALGGYVFLSKPEGQPAQNASSFGVAGMEIGGPFELVNHKGETVTEKDFKESYKLIYFGFTYCPVVCPTELQKISAALKDLGPLSDKITPIFITVDPERDTVELVREYVNFFHPDMVGLTGTREQIDNVLKSYKVYATKVEDENATDYTMDHSSFIYFMSPGGDLLKIFRTQDSAKDIAKALETYFAAKQSG